MKEKKMGVVTLTMLNIAAVLSIVNYPTFAAYGYQSLFFTTASALCFFIPCALVSAEMASALPHNGGLYLWGKEAFGATTGFITVSMQWFNSLPWYGTILTFIATTVAYMFNPELSNNPWFVYAIILAVTWGCTAVNCLGITLYARLSSIGVILGTLVPTGIIILCAIVWLGRGNAPVLPFSGKAFLPTPDNWQDWMLLAGMMVSLAGIDMTALHITSVEKPKKNYPLALLFSSIGIILGSVAGALAIAVTVPRDSGGRERRISSRHSGETEFARHAGQHSADSGRNHLRSFACCFLHADDRGSLLGFHGALGADVYDHVYSHVQRGHRTADPAARSAASVPDSGRNGGRMDCVRTRNSDIRRGDACRIHPAVEHPFERLGRVSSVQRSAACGNADFSEHPVSAAPA